MTDYPWRTVDRPYLDDDHRLIRSTTRDFVEREIAPFVDDWDEAGSFPRDLYRKAAAIGILGVGYPEEHGGSGGDVWTRFVVWEEMARSGSGGLQAGLGSLHIALPPILALGSEEQKQRLVPPVLSAARTR